MINDIRRSAGSAVDIRLWTKKAPSIALRPAAVTGLATAVLIRRDGKTASCASEGHANGKPQQPPGEPKPIEPAKAGVGSTIANSLFELAKLGLETAVMTGVREAAARGFDTGDGRDESKPIERPIG